MSDNPKPPDQPPHFSDALKKWLSKRLPFGLQEFAPWFQAQFAQVNRHWTLLLLFVALSVAATIWITYQSAIAPLKQRLATSESLKNVAEQKLAPFWAAGDRYFSNAPSAERLAALLDALTNSADDVRELRRLQSRQANLKVFMVGEGAGWTHLDGPIQSNAIVYIPLFGGVTNAGIHFALKNLGELAADVIHVDFFCPTQQLCSATQWDDMSTLSLDDGYSHFLLKLDALYPDRGFFMTPIKFSVPLYFQSLSSFVRLSIDAKNSSTVNLPFELFFFRCKTNIAPFVSTNRMAWQPLKSE